MYAIVEIGGKQLRLSQGDVVEVEKQEAEDGAVIKLDKVLLVQSDDKLLVGTPYVDKAVVEATVERQTKGPKLIAFKYKRRKATHSKKGHRQKLTRLLIKEIKVA
jgi:large subunit ribosomal protein L21